MAQSNESKDLFDLSKELIELLIKLQESDSVATQRDNADELAVYLIRLIEGSKAVQQVLEQLKLDKEEYKNALKESVGTLKESVGTLKESVGTLKESVDTLKERVDTLKERVAVLGNNIEHNNKVTNIKLIAQTVIMAVVVMGLLALNEKYSFLSAIVSLLHLVPK